ncbi:dienelactone hydrolase endo-1,3,1,4-beta-D-glucanase [Lactarius sanguifluus]|nr:dienelactone hydrolase endo-1,3,1,4-beta-D-glucanase [Lactarius sanguifluus]
MSFCKYCTSGVRHEGTKDKAILFLTDVFGLELNNNLVSQSWLGALFELAHFSVRPCQLLIDDFARSGFKVHVLEGDPVDQNAFEPEPNFDLNKWLPNHTTEHTGERVRTIIEELKSKGITIFGATCYCYGAPLVFDLAFENIIHVSVITHLSFLTAKDLDIYIEESKAPLLINSCEVDPPFPKELAETTDVKFAKFQLGYKRTYWEGVSHGFAVRGDLTNPAVAAAKEGSFEATVEWFIDYTQ